MRSSWFVLAALGLAACGGGGGGGDPVPPVAVNAIIQVAPLEIAAGSGAADLTVALTEGGSPAPALLEAHLELPPELRLPAQDRLLSASNTVMLDGNLVDGRFVVLCGDNKNVDALPLASGPLFSVRLEPTPPRRPGTYTVTVRNLRAASSGGDNVPLAADTLTVAVTIQ